jgi:predicted Co/Zn/Cd cation transporter (cation efflux family)
MSPVLHWYQNGGPLMPALTMVSVALYALAMERLFAIYGPSCTSQTPARRGLLILRALVAAAPLLGLLGTVSGMIESFEALMNGGRIGQLGHGIGYALRTTQYGLAIAVPGILLERIISRRSDFLNKHFAEVQA